MDIVSILAIVIFFVGYVTITLEHKINTHKSAISLALGGLLWIVVATSNVDKKQIKHSIEVAGSEIFGIAMFLLAAMALVEILVHYRFFDVIRLKLARFRFNDKKQFIVIGCLTFFLSALLDNLTITIVMIQIARRFFKDLNLLIMTSGIVLLANAGGAWSPIGDVTTIMLWLAGKFSAIEIITQGFIPSLTLGIVSSFFLLRQLKGSSKDREEESDIELSKGEKIVIGMTLASFSFPLFMNILGLPPYLGLLAGLGIVWILIEFIQTRSHKQTHLEANIDKFLQKTDIASINFFVGILLSVSALNALGVLESMSQIILGSQPSFVRLVLGNSILGILSAIVDNVPLTALAIDIIHVTDPKMWVLTAITVGTGGSALLIGSVAGVVAMGMVKELNFSRYLRIATIPALIGYFFAIAIWLLQYQLIR